MSEQECLDAIKVLNELTFKITWDNWDIGTISISALGRIRYRIEQRLDEILDAEWLHSRW